MSRIMSLAISGSLAAVSILLGLLLLGNAQVTASALPQSSTGGGGCVVAVDHLAAPPVLLKGEEVELQIFIRPTCTFTDSQHIVLVLDASGSMSGRPNLALKVAANTLLRQMDLVNHPERRIAVVAFNDFIRVSCPLTNDVDEATRCIQRVGANRGTRIDLGIDEGQKLLVDGRSRSPGAHIREFMLVLSDGANNRGCAPVTQSADAAKQSGAILGTICLGSGCDQTCMMRVATEPRFYALAPSQGALEPVFLRSFATFSEIALAKWRLTYHLSDKVDLVLDSTTPAADVDNDQKRVIWEGTHMSSAGFTATLRVKPLVAGQVKIGEGSVFEFQDRGGWNDSVMLRTVRVNVFGRF
jgi:uncharacterized protein YegL